MKTFKLVPIAAMLMLTTTVQATPVDTRTSETLTIEALWQWLLPQENKPELKTCPDYPRCENITAPAPESDD